MICDCCNNPAVYIADLASGEGMALVCPPCFHKFARKSTDNRLLSDIIQTGNHRPEKGINWKILDVVADLETLRLRNISEQLADMLKPVKISSLYT